jgi:hypothetical protein
VDEILIDDFGESRIDATLDHHFFGSAGPAHGELELVVPPPAPFTSAASSSSAGMVPAMPPTRGKPKPKAHWVEHVVAWTRFVKLSAESIETAGKDRHLSTHKVLHYIAYLPLLKLVFYSCLSDLPRSLTCLLVPQRSCVRSIRIFPLRSLRAALCVE